MSSPQVRTRSFTTQPPDLRRLNLDHESFATIRSLALFGTALYPILVHRLVDSLRTSSPRSVALTQLYFTSLAMVGSRKDFHLQERAHAGRAKRGAGDAPAPQVPPRINYSFVSSVKSPGVASPTVGSEALASKLAPRMADSIAAGILA